MNRCLLLALAAGCAVATPALAQEVGTLPFGGEVRVDPVGYPAPGGYNNRIVAVYDNVTNVFGNGTGGNFLGTCEQTMDDCGFANGPWNGVTGRLITEITWGVAVITGATSTEQNAIVFWKRSDVNFQGWSGSGTNMVNPAATPLAVFTANLGANNPGFIYQFTSSLAGLPGGGVAVPDSETGVVVQVGWVTGGCVPADWHANTCETHPCTSASERGIAFGSNSLAHANSASDPGTANAASIGLTLPDYARDISNAAMCANIGSEIGNGGAAGNTGNVEHRFIVITPTTGPNTGIPTTAGQQIRLRGDVVCTAPTTGVTALGAVADAGLNTTGTVGPSATRWYSLSISGAATDASLHFLDVDTEGSAADVAIAMYDSTGVMAGGLGDGFNDNGGSGNNAQLSFGIGRRAAVGDGLQYDGRNGQLNPGTYYLAVMPGASNAGDCFTALPSSNAGGAYQLHFHTNVNGAALAASVAPLVNGQDYGTLDPAAGTQVPGVVRRPACTA